MQEEEEEEAHSNKPDRRRDDDLPVFVVVVVMSQSSCGKGEKIAIILFHFMWQVMLPSRFFNLSHSQFYIPTQPLQGTAHLHLHAPPLPH
jgi:hypothetical protein